MGRRADFPFPRTDLSFGLSDGYAKGGVTVEHRDPGLELSDLSVEVSGHEALAEEFDAVHLRLCAASSVIACQLSPERPSEIFAGPHCFVSRDSTRRGWLPELRILAWRDDGSGTSSGNHIVTSARVIGSVSSDRSNLLIGRDLVQQVGQHGGVADVACCDADRAYLQCFLVHTEMQLAPKALL